MILVMQILVAIGIVLVIYAIFSLFATAKPEAGQKTKTVDSPLPKQDLGKEQKIQRLQAQLTELDDQLKKSKEDYAKEESEFNRAKEEESKLVDDLKRRDEWLAKTEAELAKIKLENADLNKKFTGKEKELEEEFTKNVNLTRAVNDMKTTLNDKDMGLKLKEDQIQTQKHQIEDQLKSIKEQLSIIAEFKRKEKISEWVPKAEFSKLNEEYSQLEKELEDNQDRLKVFAEEIAHLRKEVNKNTPPPAQAIVEEKNSLVDKEKPGEEISFEEAKPEEAKPEEAKPEEAKPEEAKPSLDNNSGKEAESAEVKKEDVDVEENNSLPDNSGNTEKPEENKE